MRAFSRWPLGQLMVNLIRLPTLERRLGASQMSMQGESIRIGSEFLRLVWRQEDECEAEADRRRAGLERRRLRVLSRLTQFCPIWILFGSNAAKS
jgi:hypothetical protein